MNSLPNFPTLLEMLAQRAQQNQEKTAYHFKGEARSFGELWDHINQFAARVVAAGVQPGEHVVIAIPNGHEFFTAFYGVQRAGGIAVPIFPSSGRARIQSIAAHCGASTIIFDPLHPLREADFAPLKVLLVPKDLSQPLELPTFPTVRPNDIAFIQYTSGSTDDPKGVQLTHAGLLTNLSQMIMGMDITAADRFVSWLPIYHDMGLILMTMVPFLLAAELYLLPTSLVNVRSWLQTIETQQATFTSAPDFAYRLCLRFIPAGNEPNLTSLRIAMNAAEPVRAETIRSFEEKFGLQNVMTAGYGLAEATVGVSMSKPGAGVTLDERGFAAVTPAFPGNVITIRHSAGTILPTGQAGEIYVQSPANTIGYLNNPAANDHLFSIPGAIRTGDIGYLDETNQLFIIGRMKNIIKRAGATIAPGEIEEVVDQHPLVRVSAALGIEIAGMAGEQVFVFVELRDRKNRTEKEYFELVTDIVTEIQFYMGFRPGRVILLRTHSIPQTENGKIKHALLKQKYLANTLQQDRQILY